MKEQIPFDFEGKKKEEEEKRPDKSEEENLADIQARMKKSGAKGFEPIHPKYVDDHRKKYTHE